MVILLIKELLQLNQLSLHFFELLLSRLLFSLNLAELLLSGALLPVDRLLFRLHLGNVLLDLHLLKLFLFNLCAERLNLIARLGHLVLLIFDHLAATSHFILKLLFEAAHQSVHHLIASNFDLQCALQLGILASQLLEGLIARVRVRLQQIQLLGLLCQDLLRLGRLELLLVELRLKCLDRFTLFLISLGLLLDLI